MERNFTSDFRTELYKKYVTEFKHYIGSDDTVNYKSLYKVFKRRYLSLIKHFSDNAMILDVGCGTGYLLSFLNKAGYNNLYGIDISEEQVNIVKKKGLNADKINFFDFIKINKKKYDIIFAMDVVEHFHKEELVELFNGFYSLLNENGILIIHTPNGDGIFPHHIIYGDLTHLTIFNPNSLGQILRISGFDNIKFFETGPVPKNFYGIIRLFLWRIIRIIYKVIKTIETGGADKILTQDFITAAYKLNDKKYSLKSPL